MEEYSSSTDIQHTTNNFVSYNYQWPRDNNQYYLNKEDNIFVESLFELGLSKFDYIKRLSNKVSSHHIKYTSLVVGTIHKAASHERLDILEYYLNNSNDRIKLANCPFGKQGYTPIFRAAYNGNIMTLKMLVCAGADLLIKNMENESVLDAIEEGKTQNIIKNPEDTIFINERYDDCKNYISNYKNKEDKEIKFKKL